MCVCGRGKKEKGLVHICDTQANRRFLVANLELGEVGYTQKDIARTHLSIGIKSCQDPHAVGLLVSVWSQLLCF